MPQCDTIVFGVSTALAAAATVVFGALLGTSVHKNKGTKKVYSGKGSVSAAPKPLASGFVAGGLGGTSSPSNISGALAPYDVQGTTQTAPVPAVEGPVGEPTSYARPPGTGGPRPLVAGASLAQTVERRYGGGNRYTGVDEDDQVNDSLHWRDATRPALLGYKSAYEQQTGYMTGLGGQSAILNKLDINASDVSRILSGEIPGPVSVAITSATCPACIRMKGLVKELMDSGKLRPGNLAILDTSQLSALDQGQRDRLQAQYVPTMYRFVNGTSVANKTGFKDKEDILKFILAGP